ncbi:MULTISPECIES: hypothetical protein [unclassified Raoultella]|uniref:hypothetical protein n=1 Tax=unclassified Raoultella TaxID=2627600 RepID=UPI00135C7469|nr:MULTISPECIES: hypothetical protein [unclassified Raoultella]
MLTPEDSLLIMFCDDFEPFLWLYFGFELSIENKRSSLEHCAEINIGLFFTSFDIVLNGVIIIATRLCAAANRNTIRRFRKQLIYIIIFCDGIFDIAIRVYRQPFTLMLLLMIDASLITFFRTSLAPDKKKTSSEII